jgi:rod shape-determining protein MreB
MLLFRKLFGAQDIALDIGTANTRMFAKGSGLVAEEPTIVKLSVRTAGGEEVGVDVLPMKGGVVVNADAATALLKPLINRVRRFGLFKPRALVCVPTDATAREQRTLMHAAAHAGLGPLTLVPEPLAAAVGAGIDISSFYSQMIMDIGDGVTDIAVFRAGTLTHTFALRKACSDLHAAVRNAVKDDYRVLLRREDAEFLSRQCGVTANDGTLVVSGTHCETGRETQLQVHITDLRRAQEPVLNAMIGALNSFLKNLRPHTATEVIESGLFLTGGGACLPGMADLIAQRTSLQVNIVRDPLHSVIEGARLMLS